MSDIKGHGHGEKHINLIIANNLAMTVYVGKNYSIACVLYY